MATPLSQTGLLEQVVQFLEYITTPAELPESSLRRYGLLRDPFTVPLKKWVGALLSITGEREVLLAAAILCRALKISWNGTDFHSVAPSRIVIPYNRHRVFLVALILADKYYTDDAYKTGTWAKRFHYWDAPTLLSMEVAFLQRLDWQLRLTPTEFNSFLSFLRLPNTLALEMQVSCSPLSDDEVDCFSTDATKPLAGGKSVENLHLV
eukprot:Rmarinus@m.3705